MSHSRFSHMGEEGQARMVDISGKRPTARTARAQATVTLGASTVRQMRACALPKGNPMEVARVAGIMAAKRTPELIPLCHPLPLDWVEVRIGFCEAGAWLESEVRTHASTGAEMEALTAVAVAALTLYDMVKAVDREAAITDLCVVKKTGGKSGRWSRGEVHR